ncbi:MAG: NUDIX domain-containing protein [Patescibacteria group bacterium]
MTHSNEIFTNRRLEPVVKPKNKAVEKRYSAYGVFIKESKVLMVKPTWTVHLDLPGGKIEIGETPDQGLYREFLEETGYKILKYNPKPVFQLKQNFYSEEIDEYFDSELSFYAIQKIEHEKLAEVDTEEINEISWVKVEDLNKKNCKEFNIRAIKLVIKA